MRKLPALSAVLLLCLIALPSYGALREHVLDNGLKVLIIEDHKVPLAIFQIWYRVGSRDEAAGTTGISHLLEHMMFKGTPKYGSKAFSRIVQRNGGMDNAHTAKDHTMYFQTLASDRIGLSVELEADRMANLTLDPMETAAERNVVMEERRLRYEDDPQNSLYEALLAASFTAHSYRNPIIGWMSDIANIEQEDLVRHYRRFYTPDNAFIVVAGDVVPGEILGKIREAFGSIPPSRARKAAVTREPEQRGEKHVTLRREAELPYLLAGFHTPSFPHEDSFGLEVLGMVLSGGKSARLYTSIVYEQKLALHAGADYSGLYIDPFLFVLWATAAPGRDMAEVEKALFAEIARIQDNPPSGREVQKAKNQIEASFIFGQDSLYMQAMQAGTFETLGGWRLMDAYLEGIRKVTPEEVQRVARKYLTQDNRTVAVLVPLKQKEAAR